MKRHTKISASIDGTTVSIDVRVERKPGDIWIRNRVNEMHEDAVDCVFDIVRHGISGFHPTVKDIRIGR